MLISIFILNYLIKPVYSNLNPNSIPPNTLYEEQYKIKMPFEEQKDDIYTESIEEINIEQETKVYNEPIEQQNELIIENEELMLREEKLEDIKQTENDFDWYLIIPKIELSAPIQEGTTPQILDKYIGHFETTSVLEGCIGLCAHNRGYSVNYFNNLDTLELGDEVKYKYKNLEKVYIVEDKKIINSNDWSLLEQKSEENILILITCVNNQPQQRLAVICKEG